MTEVSAASATRLNHRERGDGWRTRLPELTDGAVLLRQLRLRDASTLLRHVNDPQVLQFIAPCPTTVDGFERFVRWTHVERRRGHHACYGIVPRGASGAVGIIQLWSIERDFSTAEWGFAIGESFWGTGVFSRSAHLFLDAIFLGGFFGARGVRRLEARAVVHNARGNGFLRKLGLTPEGVLRGGFHYADGALDQNMWSMLASEWTRPRARQSGATHS
ncbi:MAG TPA: GNAT family protein [Vicinamibacterales bacterium]|jgi:RimJ/RimL family protein N-acetyltransferase